MQELVSGEWHISEHPEMLNKNKDHITPLT